MGQEEKDTYTMIGWMSFRIGYPQRLIMLNRENEKTLAKVSINLNVPTLLGDEMVQVDIPRGSRHGDCLKLDNLGFPVLYGGDAKGDQLVHLVGEHEDA